MNFQINKLCILTCFLLFSGIIYAVPPTLSKKDLSNPLPRTIRSCCSFGTDLNISMVPLVKYSATVGRNEIGKHQYLGNLKENNGIVYTQKGGFIDLGHLRDHVDWTAYLYLQIQRAIKDTINDFYLGYEGGIKNLHLNLSKDIDSTGMILLAGKIAFDISLWHEIATWFGASAVPLLNERFSSFSPEDMYSNLLGVTIGMEAIKSSLSYEEAVTLILDRYLTELGAVETAEETDAAMESVLNIWWTKDKKLPNEHIILSRYTNVFSSLYPWLISDQFEGYELKVPSETTSGALLSGMYILNIKINFRFPFNELFPTHYDKTINQHNFRILIDYIEHQYQAPVAKKQPNGFNLFPIKWKKRKVSFS